MAKTIGSFPEFKKTLPHIDDYRAEAAETYLKNGVIKVDDSRLVYPSTPRLKKQIQEKEEQKQKLEKQLKEWDERNKNLDTHKTTDMLERAVNPVYWEHKLKMLTDQNYREVYELVKPPMHLINRKKWNKRLKMFVKSSEYRLRLKEARKSQIGKRRDKMDEEVEARMKFNRQLASVNRNKLEKKRKKLEEQIKAMRALALWAKESGV